MPDAGWHFSWMCGADVDRLKRKRDSVADDVAWPDESLLQRVVQGPFVPLDNSFPKYLVDHQAQFSHLIHP